MQNFQRIQLIFNIYGINQRFLCLLLLIKTKFNLFISLKFLIVLSYFYKGK